MHCRHCRYFQKLIMLLIAFPRDVRNLQSQEKSYNHTEEKEKEGRPDAFSLLASSIVFAFNSAAPPSNLHFALLPLQKPR